MKIHANRHIHLAIVSGGTSEAKEMVNTTVFFRDEFFLWLSKKVSNSQLSEYCIACVDIEEFCLQEKILERKLFEITDLKVIENLIAVLSSSKVYKKFRANHKHNFSKVEAALKYYCEFLKIKKGSLAIDFTSASKASNDTNSEKKSDTSKENVATVKRESTAETTERILSSKKAFKKWLKVKYFKETIAVKYLNLADTINKMLKDRKIISRDLFLITSPEQLRTIKKQLFGSVSFANLNFMTAFDDFISFRKENPETPKNFTSNVAPKNQAEPKSETFKPTSKAESTEVKNATVENSESTSKKIIANREAFRTWLKSKYTSQTTLYICFDMMDAINEMLRAEGIFVSNLFLTTDSKKLSEVKDLLLATTSFKILSNSRKNDILTAFNNWIEFQQPKPEEKNFSPEPPIKAKSIEVKSTAVEKVESIKDDFKSWLKLQYPNKMTALICFETLNDINKILKSEKLYVTDLFSVADSKKLVEVKDLLITAASFQNLSNARKNDILTAFYNLIKFLQNSSVKEKISVSSSKAETFETKTEKNLSSFEKYVEMQREHFNAGVPKPQQQSTSTAEIIPETPTVKELSKIEKYAEILSKFFADDGYRLNFIIHSNKFKKRFFEEYGENLTENGEQLDEILSQVGTKRDDRIFPKNEEQSLLLDVIVNDIVAAFDSGASAVFVEAVYDKYKQQLADDLKIYNENDSTSLILKNANGKFFKYGTYFNPRVKKADAVGDIVKFLQENHQPLSYNEIFTALWYIPRSKIEYLIKSQIKSIVCVANEMFFYAPNLPVDETELQKISSLIQSEIDFHGYVTDAKMMELIKSKYPLIAMNLESFNTYAVRKCLSYLLAESFSFSGSVISALGKQLNLSDVYADFARNHENLTLEELKNFAKELDNNILWYPVLSEMVRISQDNFVSRRLINFNISLIDNCLEELYPQDYTPLKEITLFINFPNIGYAWNSYVLESYLYSFSRKFRLVHGSFSETGVYGAMVRNGSSITDYESVITDALSHSEALTESKALQFIVNQGYQQRKAYKNIGDVIKKAKLIKENRRKSTTP